MQTIVLERPHVLRRVDAPQPPPLRPGEALVRVRRVGVCGTDLHAFRGRQPFIEYPRILGHELGVEVLEVRTDAHAPGSDVRPGDRCAVEPYLYCGACHACRQGKTNCCVELRCLGVHCDGGMRERIVVPVANLHKSDCLSLDQLALVETLGIGAHAVQRAAVQPDEWALVIGAGPIGLSVMQFAKLAGARVVALDVQPQRLEVCQRLVGVRWTIRADSTALQQVRQLTEGTLPPVVFDATGNADSMQAAFQYVAHGGRLVFVGLVQGDVALPDPLFHRREMTLLATRNSTAAQFQRIIELLERGAIDPSAWITHRAALADAPEQFPAWIRPQTGVVKAMLECDAD
jgi:2-desacetyl-2-hydroxyethyl bacteriochlorophyllide A dehydrogenase